MTNKIIIAIATAIFSFSTYAQTVDQIISKHIEAIGGRENWKKIKSLRQESSMKMQGAEIKLVTTQVDKKAFRLDVSAMGMNGYQIMTNTEGWSFMPFQGQTKPEPMTADDVKISQDQLEIQNDFMTYGEMGKKLEDLGTEEVDGTECFKLKLTDKEGSETTYYIDQSNYFLVKESSKMTANGQEMENVVTYSNYEKTAEGIFFPKNIVSMQGAMEITKIEVNPVIDETIFTVKK